MNLSSRNVLEKIMLYNSLRSKDITTSKLSSLQLGSNQFNNLEEFDDFDNLNFWLILQILIFNTKFPHHFWINDLMSLTISAFSSYSSNKKSSKTPSAFPFSICATASPVCMPCSIANSRLANFVGSNFWTFGHHS